MTIDTRTLDAVLTLARKELQRDEWHDRAGALRALLAEAVPFLEQLRELTTSEVAS